MTTLFRTVTPEDNHSRGRTLWKLGGAAALAALVLGLIGSGGARGEDAKVDPLQIIPLAQGLASEHNINLRLKGPADVLQARLVFQPGGETGWHIHPGPVVVVVK